MGWSGKARGIIRSLVKYCRKTCNTPKTEGLHLAQKRLFYIL